MSSSEELSGYQKTREAWVAESHGDVDIGASVVKAIHEDTNFSFFCDQIKDEELFTALHYAMLELDAEEARQVEPARKAVAKGIKDILPAPARLLVLMTIENAKKADAENLREHLVHVGCEVVKTKENTRTIEKKLGRRHVAPSRYEIRSVD